MADMLDLLVVVFDSAIARFFKGDAGDGLKPAAELHSELHHFSRDVGSGQGWPALLVARAAWPRPEARSPKEEKHDFVHKLVKTLDTAYDQGAFKQLMVVAPERQHRRNSGSSPPTRLLKLVVCEVPKELAQFPDHEIMVRLRPHLSAAVEAR